MKYDYTGYILSHMGEEVAGGKMSAQRVRDDEGMLERISAEMEDRISTQPNGSTSYYQDKFMYFTELWNIGLVIGEEKNRNMEEA